MKQLILYFLLLVISSLVLVQVALLFPSRQNAPINRPAKLQDKANHTKIGSTITIN